MNYTQLACYVIGLVFLPAVGGIIMAAQSVTERIRKGRA
jgi:hypothetical protein